MPFYNWYDHLSEEGKKYGYLVNGSKSWLIVKSDLLADEEKRVFFTNGYKSKLTYYMHTIESFEDYVDPIQEAIDDLLLPTLFGQAEPLPSELRQLVTLTPAQGGLGVPDLRSEAPKQFAASKYVNNSTARRFYYHTEHVHGGRREFHGGVKKTKAS